MPLPDVFPETTVSGIAVDPKTLDRVVPATRRTDGSVRKEIKIRPGFTPQEDQSRFRGSRQQQGDKNALPKGHILGWVAPSSEARNTRGGRPAAASSGGRSLEALASGSSSLSGGSTSSGKDTSAMSKSAKKNARRADKKKEDKQKELEAKIREAWDEDSDEDAAKATSTKRKVEAPASSAQEKVGEAGEEDASLAKDIEGLKV